MTKKKHQSLKEATNQILEGVKEFTQKLQSSPKVIIRRKLSDSQETKGVSNVE